MPIFLAHIKETSNKIIKTQKHDSLKHFCGVYHHRYFKWVRCLLREISALTNLTCKILLYIT